MSVSQTSDWRGKQYVCDRTYNFWTWCVCNIQHVQSDTFYFHAFLWDLVTRFHRFIALNTPSSNQQKLMRAVERCCSERRGNSFKFHVKNFDSITSLYITISCWCVYFYHFNLWKIFSLFHKLISFRSKLKCAS